MIKRIFQILYQLTTLGMKKGPHITRYYMYNHLSRYAEHRSENLRVLSISHSQNLGELLGFNADQITNVSYPEVTVFDLPFEDESFDAVVSDQVLEHVEGSPYAAMDEAFRVLKHGGLALHTTCFINPIHACPNDFWRFSPEALVLLTSQHADAIDIGGWGNPFLWVFSGLGLRFQPIPHARWHPWHWVANHNVEEWPVVTWALVRKK